MKRLDSDDPIHLHPHTPKKVGPDTLQHNIAPAPTIPMDDLDDDDIYGDSPTIAKDGIRTPLTQVMTDEQQKQPPPAHRSPQEQTVFRLPGLHLSTGKPSGPDSSSNKDEEPHDSISVHLNGTLPTTKQEQSSVLPSEVKANGPQAMEQLYGRAQAPKSSQHHDLSLFGQHSALQGLNTTNGQTVGVELEGIETSTVGQDRLAAESCAYTPASEARVPQNEQVDTGGDIVAKETTPELLQQASPQKENEQVHTQDLLDTSEPNKPIPSQNLETVDVAKDAKSHLGCQPSNPPRSIDLQAKEKILQTLEEQRSAQSQGVIATVPAGTPTVGGSAEADERGDEETALKPTQQSITAPQNDNRLLQGNFPATEPNNVNGVHETGSASPGTVAKEVTLDPAQQPPGPRLGIEQLDVKANTEAPEPEQSHQVQGTMAAVSATSKTAENGAEAGRKNNEAEFEMDSSPIESSSDSDSESSSSSAADSDYVMLDPEEEARRLMEEHGGSDDEGKGSKGTSGPLRTLNEKPDEVVPKPQIEVTPVMAIAELGSVEQVVENTILIKAKTSGERQALETGSLLCLEDRCVIGVIAETLGQIQQPYYSVRFTNSAAIVEAGIAKGTTIFNVEQHSHYVFTQNIKAFKGSDASNIHDEEVGDDELEFSDDEAEAEHKRRVKQERLAKRGGRSDRSDGFTRGPRGGRTQRGGRFNQAVDRDQVPAPISYDEQDDGEDLYTPLARPSNLHEFMGHGEAPQEKPVSHVNGTTRARDPRLGKSDRGRGRGDRGRGARGGRGDRRGGAGYNSGFSNHQSNNARQLQHQNHPSHAHPPPPPSSLFNYDPSRPTPQNVHQPGSPYGWSNAYPSNQYNPLYGHSHQQAAPFYQQPAYSNHNPNTYQYPQMNDSQRHGSTNPLATPQSPPLPQHHQYLPHQAASPSIPAPPALPPGAHINPAFFSPTTQQSPESWPRQQSYGVPPPPGGGSRSPQSEAAFLAAQDRLSLLRQLSQG
ncbi:MAG: hypothetical protein LQ344_002218 [Seirophora lacunosa]|nr:MAG: hypothetical protein LQ344_002218 [Seirophora lacunosa]